MKQFPVGICRWAGGGDVGESGEGRDASGYGFTDLEFRISHATMARARAGRGREEDELLD